MKERSNNREQVSCNDAKALNEQGNQIFVQKMKVENSREIQVAREGKVDKPIKNMGKTDADKRKAPICIF